MEDVKSQLLALKKELKCWESMFERKHGKKPSREDIDKSPSEIRETYRQYQRLKVAGQKTIRSPLIQDGQDVNDREESRSADNNEEGVFGSHLNKSKSSEQPSCSGSEGDRGEGRGRGPTWKRRKWTRGNGYRTVVAGRSAASESQEKGEEEKDAPAKSKDETVVSTAGEDNESTDIASELSLLSQSVNIKTSLSPLKAPHSGGHVVGPAMLSRTLHKPKMGHNLSSNWLQRCKPDLSTLQESEHGSDASHRQTISSDTPREPVEGSLKSEVEDDSGMECSVSAEGEDSELDVRFMGSREGSCSSANDEVVELEEEETEEEEEEVEEEKMVEEEGEEEEDGWDGRLQESPKPDAHIFHPSQRQGLFVQSRLHPMSNSGISSGATTHAAGDTSIATDTEGLKQAKKQLTHGNTEPQGHSLYSAWGSCDVASAHQQSVSTDEVGSQNTCLSSTNMLGLKPASHAEPTTLSLDTQLKESSSSHTFPEPANTSTLSCLEQDSCLLVHTPRSSKTQVSNKKWRLQGPEDIGSTGQLSSQQPVPKSTAALSSSGGRSKKRSTVKPVETSSTAQGSEPASFQSVESFNGLTKKPISAQEDGSQRQRETPKAVSGSAPTEALSSFSSNSVSDNFVRLNLKVKRFSRKRGGLTGSAYKRRMWKKYQKGQSSASFRGGGGGGGRGSNACFKCGKPGHWAKDCTEREGSKNLGSFAGEKVQFSDSMELDHTEEMDSDTLQQLARDSPFPTTREAALMARGVRLEQSRQAQAETAAGSEEPFVPLPPCNVRPPSPPPPMEPLFPSDNGNVPDTPSSVMPALRKLGYQSFRPGQEQAIVRILSGISTLLVQPTGSGKSLCYQLPAYLYSQRSNCITLVISPLVSLMEDQVHRFPPCLKGACLHTNQTQSQRQRVMSEVADGRVNVLLLSPEALVSGAFWSGWGKHAASRLPPVAFACIDEAHCVSEWSHNFRPSYLRVHKVLRERLGVQCILGLTATATKATALSVASHLSIAEENVIRGSAIPENLHITVSCDDDRNDALLQLLQSPKLRNCNSIIIYCTRQVETERVAQLLRTSLQFLPLPEEPQEASSDEEEVSSTNTSTVQGNKGSSRKRARKSTSKKRSKRTKLEWSVDSYHAGKSAAERKRVQQSFMTGRLRIVVATVAFGMGLNKADVRAIIHYNIPKSFESYVQEIGRAGRDGKPAFCHVFINKEGTDLCELRRHAHSNTVDPYSIKQLVMKAFPSCQCKQVKASSQGDTAVDFSSSSSDAQPDGVTRRFCAGHEVSIPTEATVRAFDVKEESISTLLCYLELQGWLEVKGVKKDTCTLKCYGGPRQLRALAQKVPAIAAATARMREKGKALNTASSISFSTIEVASSMGWESHIMRSELRDLQFNDRQTSSNPNHSGSTVLVEFSDPAFHLVSPGDLSPGELDSICEYLRQRVKTQETLEVDKLHLLYSVLLSVACDNIHECYSGEGKSSAQSRLMELINEYFEDKLNCDTAIQMGIRVLKLPSEISPELEGQIARDVYSLMSIHSDRSFSGRAIARIFHGIASPCFPAEVWSKQRRFWRRYLEVDFNLLCQLATRKGLELRNNV